MAVTDLPIFQALRTKMQWHQTRQKVLAENVANADTPDFHSRDIKQVSFTNTLKGSRSQYVQQAVTQEGHMRTGSHNGPNRPREVGSFEITPEGNSVVLEEQMMKITANQMDYQAATSIYTRGMGLIKTALGKR
ncbi:flagellar basal body rod protein FlgB [Breoghania sp. L-A4]|nr:flagellar basal body rod protein FlgB [Breoghania sp. L-A4]AXS41202.1 flagellar basal body rod protein FlgB [Breoghania sp. L-A4]